MTEELLDTDTVAENLAKEGSRESTGYPYKLTEEQVTSLIYFFGSRKISNKAFGTSSKTSEMTTDEKRSIAKIMDWFGFVVTTPTERKAAYRAVIAKFKSVCDFLKNHPAYISMPIKKALEECGYQNILKNIVMVVSSDGKLQPRVASEAKKAARPPIGQLDQLMWEFQNVALDKLRMIIDTIDYKDVKKANLGMKSKALRDIYSVVHMVRLGNKNPNMTLVSVNVNTSEPKEKMAAYGTYIQKNREQNS